jgi:ectoine hydroxylase-related dioxygenase (phytanoyl-CoA dioxygenase family)
MLPRSGDAGGEQIINARLHDATLEAWALDRAVGELVAGLLGCRRVQLMQDTVLLKPPRTGRRIHWHQDYWRMHRAGLRAPRAVSVRLALTPEVRATGCLEVLDSSQTWGFIRRQILSRPRVAAMQERVLTRAGGRGGHATTALELDAGDISVHHCLTVHSSERNVSPHPRKTVIVFVADANRGPRA